MAKSNVFAWAPLAGSRKHSMRPSRRRCCVSSENVCFVEEARCEKKTFGKTAGFLPRGACTCGGAAGGRKTGKEGKRENCAFSCDCAKRNFRIALFAKRGTVFLPFAAPTRVQAPRGTKGMALAKRSFTTFLACLMKYTFCATRSARSSQINSSIMYFLVDIVIHNTAAIGSL